MLLQSVLGAVGVTELLEVFEVVPRDSAEALVVQTFEDVLRVALKAQQSAAPYELLKRQGRLVVRVQDGPGLWKIEARSDPKHLQKTTKNSSFLLL